MICMRSQIRFGFSQKNAPLLLVLQFGQQTGVDLSLEIIFGLAPNLCQFERPRCWESISPENSIIVRTTKYASLAG